MRRTTSKNTQRRKGRRKLRAFLERPSEPCREAAVRGHRSPLTQALLGAQWTSLNILRGCVASLRKRLLVWVRLDVDVLFVFVSRYALVLLQFFLPLFSFLRSIAHILHLVFLSSARWSCLNFEIEFGERLLRVRLIRVGALQALLGRHMLWRPFFLTCLSLPSHYFVLITGG